MNTRFLKWLLTVTVFFCMIFVAANVAAKKPVPPPPPPDPVDYGSLCADSGSFFPAFAYIFTGEIFLSNSAGDCSISIYTAELTTGGPYDISYRFFSGPEEGSGHGKIVWAYWDTDDTSIMDIKLLEFQVEAGAITTTFPLTPRIVLQESDSVRVRGRPDLSPDGNKIIVAASENGGVRGYIWEFDIPESGAVAIDDIRELARLDENEDPVEYATFHNIRYGLSDQRERIYFGYDYPDRKLAFIEKGMYELWSEPVLIAERYDGVLGPGSVGLWDFGSGLREVLTFSTTVSGNGPIEILDVDACVGGVGDCVVLDSIEGYDATSFTTFTEGQLPALLYLYVAEARTRHVVFSIRECDLSVALASPDACYRTVIDGIKDPKRSFWDVDSAD